MAAEPPKDVDNSHDITQPDDAPKSSFPVLPLLNLAALLGTCGFFYYSKMIFKRPPITETSERERLSEPTASPLPSLPGPVMIQFEPITVNIKSNPEKPLPADGTRKQIQGKLHYVTVGLALEIRDREQRDIIENLRPMVLDKLIELLGKKAFHELITAQGRYMIQSEMINFTTRLVALHSSNPSKDPLVQNIYFTQFILQ